MLFTIQIIAIVLGLLAFAWFARSNMAIMKFRNFSSAGLLQLWTGNIDTRQLITGNTLVPGRVEKDLVKAVMMYKRSRTVFYAALFVNLVAFILHNIIFAATS